MNSNVMIALLMIGIIICICAILVYIHKRDKKKREWQQRNLFKQLVITNEITVSNEEQFRDRMIALDAKKQVVVFLDFLQNSKAAVIDLKKAAFCSIVKISGDGYFKDRNNANRRLIHSIALEVASHKQENLGRFVFFDFVRDNSMDIISLTNRAEYWKKLINQAAGFK